MQSSCKGLTGGISEWSSFVMEIASDVASLKNKDRINVSKFCEG